MSPTDCLGVPWPALTARLEPPRTLARWARREPALRPFGCLDDVAHALHRGRDPDQADAVLGALLRLSATDGGDEPDAALLVAHLLNPGTRRLALELRDLSDDIDDLIAGAVWLKIRTFPWQHRTRAYAKNVLLDTRLAVLGELRRAYRTVIGPGGRTDRVVLVDPSPPAQTGLSRDRSVLDHPMWDPHDRDELQLADVLDWAQRSGVVSSGDVALLVDLAVAGDQVNLQTGQRRRSAVNCEAEIVEVARRRGVEPRTVWRQRYRAISRLRAARERYLRAVA